MNAHPHPMVPAGVACEPTEKDRAAAAFRRRIETVVGLVNRAFSPVLAKVIVEAIRFMSHHAWLGDQKHLTDLLADIERDAEPLIRDRDEQKRRTA